MQDGPDGRIKMAIAGGRRRIADLPDALIHFDTVLGRLAPRRPAVFLDYDGTLTPIAARPEEARLSPTMRQTLRRLATCCPVGVVSGRALADVQALVGLTGLHYAGDHGFAMRLPDGRRIDAPRAGAWSGLLDRLQEELERRLAWIEGCLIERKTYSLAVHYRLVRSALVDDLLETVRQVAAGCAEVRLTEGKKVLEVQVDIDWHKGEALRLLLAEAGGPRLCPLYIGDDLTDEDAFAAIEGEGVGIVVRGADRPTRARFALDDCRAVGTFLDRLARGLAATA